jgi:hypothetical protein
MLMASASLTDWCSSRMVPSVLSTMCYQKTTLICKRDVILLSLSVCRALLEKPPVNQLFKNSPTSFKARKLTGMLTRTRRLFLSRIRHMQFIEPHPIFLISVFILSYHLPLHLPIGLFPSSFPTKTLYAFVFTISATCLVHCMLSQTNKTNKQNLWHLVRKRTIPNMRPSLVGEVSTNFRGRAVSRVQSNGFPRSSISVF